MDSQDTFGVFPKVFMSKEEELEDEDGQGEGDPLSVPPPAKKKLVIQIKSAGQTTEFVNNPLEAASAVSLQKKTTIITPVAVNVPIPSSQTIVTPVQLSRKDETYLVDNSTYKVLPINQVLSKLTPVNVPASQTFVRSQAIALQVKVDPSQTTAKGLGTNNAREKEMEKNSLDNKEFRQLCMDIIGREGNSFTPNILKHWPYKPPVIDRGNHQTVLQVL